LSLPKPMHAWQRPCRACLAKLNLFCGGSHLVHGTLGPSPHCKRHLDPLSRSCSLKNAFNRWTEKQTDRHTDRPTDRAIYRSQYGLHSHAMPRNTCRPDRGCVLQVRNIKRGDVVRILDEEDAVRTLQNGHGSWNYKMKHVRGISLRN